MLKLNTSARFKRDFRLCAKRGYDLELLQSVVDTLRIPARSRRKTRITHYPGIGAGIENAIYCRIGY